MAEGVRNTLCPSGEPDLRPVALDVRETVLARIDRGGHSTLRARACRCSSLSWSSCTRVPLRPECDLTVELRVDVSTFHTASRDELSGQDRFGLAAVREDRSDSTVEVRIPGPTSLLPDSRRVLVGSASSSSAGSW